ncbi:MAG: rod shape-determining protein MreC [Desulfovibrio sp.]
MNSKKIAAYIAAFLFLYLSLYTWNLRSGKIDALASYTGLEVVGWVLKPGHWVSDQCVTFWNRYIYLMDVRAENERLLKENDSLLVENYALRTKAASAERLERLLLFTPLPGWETKGVHVVAHRIGPVGLLDTVMLDKGSYNGVYEDMPVVSSEGVMGRILKVAYTTSTMLLLTDPASRVAVISQKNRSSGMATGVGDGQDLKIRYIPQNAIVEEGELFVTSGLDGVFPPGIPVAHASDVSKSDISLFLDVEATPVVTARLQEEALIVFRTESNSTMTNGTIALEVHNVTDGV